LIRVRYANGQLELSVIEACVERGLRVPEDVSVVGFDAAVSATPA
jgi:DNA-binding LacI/PurR family transcriptional regulator